MLPCLEAGRAAQQRHRRVRLHLVHARQGRLQEPREERRHDLPGHHVTYPVSCTISTEVLQFIWDLYFWKSAIVAFF